MGGFEQSTFLLHYEILNQNENILDIQEPTGTEGCNLPLMADEKRDKEANEEEVLASTCASQSGLQRPGKWELACIHPSAVWPFRSPGLP